ncbi:glycosyltransferase [Cellulomonas endophytica]|uniref:glycosyltransferase n=1 Tax=Cellulomonas endophytica TaxID=2494735 RepID=UPI001010D103|nr:glycosyltransferase [Cellulomonas endophytica]
MSTTTAAPTTTRVLQRVVLPVEGDLDVLPLYVEGTSVRAAAVAGAPEDEPAGAAPQRLEQVLDRHRYRVPASGRSSFGTYFNAFPASYWRRWTTVASVTLRVRVSGTGSVFVYRSNAKGDVSRVTSEAAPASGEELAIELPLTRFADGGWYWFDVVAGDGPCTLEHAAWTAEVPEGTHQGTATVAITTLNRPDDVVALLGQLGADPEVLPVLDAVLLVDQGTQHPEDAEGFAAAEAALGGRLRVIHQGNLGGSGGFSRGMLETVDAGRSDYVLISDDDVRTEPEGLLRAVAFGDLARTPTIVGGHMFSMFDRAFLHSMGERVQPWRFWWGPVLRDSHGFHLDRSSLRTTAELHRRVDVDYNGWWNCLIPTGVVRDLGLSLPFFIKWDDAEYGLRAKAAGVPTVSLPGVAVWHVPWTDKDDSLDWQAYYHQRNRFVAALLHSRYERGGRLVRESFLHQVRHLLSSQYSVAELRLQALEDLLEGPEHLHRDLATRLPRIRQVRARFPDARVSSDPGAYPAPRREKLPRKGEDVTLPEGRLPALAMAAVGVVKQLRPTRPSAQEAPEAQVAAVDARWWLLAQFDSAVVSTSDGGGAAWYHRDPELFRDLLRRSGELHARVLREWPELAQRYRASLDDLVSPEAWRPAFAPREDG